MPGDERGSATHGPGPVEGRVHRPLGDVPRADPSEAVRKDGTGVLLVEPFGIVVIPLAVVPLGQAGEGSGHGGMLRPQELLAHGKASVQQFAGFRMANLNTGKAGQVGEAGGDDRVIFSQCFPPSVVVVMLPTFRADGKTFNRAPPPPRGPSGSRARADRA